MFFFVSGPATDDHGQVGWSMIIYCWKCLEFSSWLKPSQTNIIVNFFRLTVAQLKCQAVVRNGELQNFNWSSKTWQYLCPSDNFQKTSTRCEEFDRGEDLDLLACLNGFCLVVGSKLEVIFASQNIQSFCGLSPEDVMGHHLTDFVHPCDHVVSSANSEN